MLTMILVSLGVRTVRVMFTSAFAGVQIGDQLGCVAPGIGHRRRAAGDGVTGRRQIVKSDGDVANVESVTADQGWLRRWSIPPDITLSATWKLLKFTLTVA